MFFYTFIEVSEATELLECSLSKVSNSDRWLLPSCSCLFTVARLLYMYKNLFLFCIAALKRAGSLRVS
jgi:hypothetical protein